MKTLSYQEEVASVSEGLLLTQKVKDSELSQGEKVETGTQRGGRGGGPGHGQGGGAINRETIAGMGPTLSRLLKMARKYRPHMIAAVILALAGATMSVLTPRFLGDITDEISAGLMGNLNMDEVQRLVIICASLVIAGFAFNYLQSWLMATATQRLSQQLRTSIDRKVDRTPLAYFDSTSQGDTLSRVTNDIDTLSQALNSSVSTVLSGIALLLGSTIMMFATDWRMALAGIAAALVGFMLTMVLIGLSQKYFLAKQRQLGALNGHIEETLSGLPVVRAYNAEPEAKAEFAERNTRLYGSTWRADFLSGMMFPIMGFIGNLGYVVVCIVGAVLVINGDIAIGVITSFMLYIRLFTQPLSNIAQAATQFQGATAAGDRVFELLDETELPDESSLVDSGATNVSGEVVFDNVHFGYQPDQEIIHGFSAVVKPGQKVAIVGPTGAGKTTLVNLLMRFYDVDSGQILLDGVPIQEMTREDVANHFSMVLQDTWLFHGTLRENLVYQAGSHEHPISDAQLDEVVDEVGLRNLVDQLPQGYDTVLGEDSALSAGQKQLVTIARAMIDDKPLLILDEATSSIDTRTEQLIQKAVDRLTSGRTSFIIAHRLSTIRNADVIFVLNDGDIVETGNHEQLLAKGGFYADLYNSQFDPVGA